MKTNVKIATHIPLQGSCNTRHLGGYQTPYGITKPFAYIRSEAPGTLTDADIGLLLKLGIRTVVDLRNPSEVAQSPTPLACIPSITWHNVPIFTDDAALDRFDTMDRGESYCWMLDSFQRPYRDALRVLSQSDGVFFHCAAGKDRTGLLSMLLLLLAGVDEDTVAQEYAYTQILLAPWVEQASANTPDLPEEALRQLHGAYPEFLYEAISHLATHYHGVTGYLTAIGLTGAEIELLRARMIPSHQSRLLRYSA